MFSKGGNISFFDHETDDITILSNFFKDFSAHCKKENTTLDDKLKNSQVISVEVDPKFAKKHGINVHKNGKIK